jgi:hypothetical protein
MNDRETIEAARKAEAQRKYMSAMDGAKETRQKVIESLRSRLASCYDVRAYDRKSDYGTEYFGVTVKRAQAPWFKFELSFRVESATRYLSSMPHYKLAIRGSTYTRNDRSFTPLYEFDKKGFLNMTRMAEDVERAYEAQRTYHERNQAVASRTAYSRAEFIKVCEQTGVQPAYVEANYGTLRIGDFEIEVTAGDIYDGKVRVKLSLHKAHLTAEETVALVKRLRNA